MFFERLAQDRLFVQFDRRGFALSERNVDDLSLEAHVADVAAVVDDLGFEQFDLYGAIDGAAVAVAFAAQHPEQVSKLVLWASYSHGKEIGPPEEIRGIVELIRNNWRLATRATADITFPTGPTELIHALSD